MAVAHAACCCWLSLDQFKGAFGSSRVVATVPGQSLSLCCKRVSNVPFPSLLAFKAAKTRATLQEAVTTATLANRDLAVALTGCCSGLVAGLLHSTRSPERLATLAPLALAQTSKLDAAALGAAWACGHQLGQALFSTIFLLLKNKLRPRLLLPWSDWLIALATATVGVVAALELLSGNRNRDRNRSWISGRNQRSLAFALAIGLVYGLQPDALLMTLPVRSMPSRLAGCLFLAMSILAQVASVICSTSLLTWLGQAVGNRLKWTTPVLRWLSSLFALVFGLAMLGLPLLERYVSPV